MYLVVDSWGNFPSGIFNGNIYDFGAFRECFHIERNGNPYKTQYCIGQGILFHHNNNTSSRNSVTISLGLCLPATCAIKHLESVVNQVINTELSNMIVSIPEKRCQHEENITGWKPLDFFTM